MKLIGRWAFRLFILLLVLSAVLVLLKDTLLKSIIESRIRTDADLEVKIGKFEMGLFSPVIDIEDAVLYNDAEFGGGPFLKVSSLHLEYDRTALSAHKLHLKLARINVAELNVVKNADGVSNLQAWEKKFAAKKPFMDLEFDRIDTLNLSLGKITVTNLKPPRTTQEAEIGMKNEIVTNVKSETDVMGLLLKLMIQHGKLLKSLYGLQPVFPSHTVALLGTDSIPW